MVHIPYKGAAAALQDLIGGQIQLLFDAASGLINPGKTGQVRLIGVAAERRLPMLPEVPTFIEQGIAGFTGSTWAGLLAPARTPPAIIKRVSGEVSRIVQLDDVKSRLEGMGTLPAGSTPEEFAAFIDAETAKWGKVIREAKVKLD
jgi:tripartite-type tricarboxylate transporter receptor subunit TctC